MSNPFKGIDVPGLVKTELNSRADTSKALRWTAKRVPWIHVMSMSNACTGNYNVLGNSVFLAGGSSVLGTTPKTSLYDKASGLPFPVVTGVEVGALGNLGSTRKATVKVKAYTDEQLVELQKCYFIPGMDVRVQFGWNESCTGESAPPVYIDVVNRAQAVCEMHNRAKANTAYDGLQGIVSNFKYSLQNDNTWDCEIEINSPADPFAESNVSDSQCGCTRKTKMTDSEGNEKEGVAKNGQLYAMLLDCFTDPNNAAQWASKLKSNEYAGSPTLRGTVGWSSRHYFGKVRNETGGDDSSWYEGNFLNPYDTTEQYISYGMLEAAINAYTVPNAKGLPYGRIDSSGIVLPTPTTIVSTDPRVCVIGGGAFDVTALREGGIPNAVGGGTSQAVNTNATAAVGTQATYVASVVGGPIGGIVAANIANNIADSQAHDAGIASLEGGGSLAAPGGGLTLCNVELNVIFLMMELKKVLDGDKKMSTFLRAVVDEVNRVCGNPWNIEIIASSETTSGCGSRGGMQGAAISVVDVKQYEPTGPYMVPAKPGKSAARNISLDLKMTGAMKTQALYGPGTQQRGSGNTAAGGDATGCEGKSMEPFYVGQGVTKNRAMDSATKTDKTKCDCDEIDTPKKEPEPSFQELGLAVYDYVSDETCKALLNALVERIHTEAKPHCAGVPLPFDFSFEVDGIGGFRWGQVVSCDRIPAGIRKNMQWQVTKVDHSITANDWITKVGTVAKPL